jgi:putative transposase
MTSGRDRRSLNVISALTWRPRARRRRHRHGLYFRVHDEPIGSEQVIEFLRHLLRHIRGPIDILLDQLGAHRSKLVRAFLARHRRLHLHFFPSYSPDRNPDEYVWGHLKRRELAHYAPTHSSQLHAALSDAVARTRARPKLLEAFIRAAGLP